MQGRHISQHPRLKDSPLGYLPLEWEIRHLGQLLTSIDAGKSPECPDIPAPAGEWGILKVSAIRPGGFRPEENKAIINPAFINSAYEVHDGDLLISRANTYELVGLVCLVQNTPPHLLLCDKTLRLNVDTRNALVKLVFYAMQMPSVRSQIEINATGSSGSMKNISQETIKGLLIPLPPLPEQRRIAEMLDTMDAAIQQTEALIAKLKLMKAGLLHDLLTRGLDEQEYLRDPDAHPEQFKDSPLGRIPRAWEATTIGELGVWRGGSTPTKAVASNWSGGTILWVSPKDIRGTEISDSEDKITYRALAQSTLSLFSEGDVLVVFRSGILRHTFPVAVGLVPFTVNQDIKVLAVRPGIYRRFAFYALQAMGS